MASGRQADVLLWGLAGLGKWNSHAGASVKRAGGQHLVDQRWLVGAGPARITARERKKHGGPGPCPTDLEDGGAFCPQH